MTKKGGSDVIGDFEMDFDIPDLGFFDDYDRVLDYLAAMDFSPAEIDEITAGMGFI